MRQRWAEYFPLLGRKENRCKSLNKERNAIFKDKGTSNDNFLKTQRVSSAVIPEHISKQFYR